MEDPINQTGPKEQAAPKRRFWPFLVVGGLLILIAAGGLLLNSINKNSHKATAQRPLDPTEYALIDGMYSAEFIEKDTVTYASAEISRLGGRRYLVSIYSKYAPARLKAVLSEDGSFRCDTLGVGTISYKPAIETIFIVFNETKINKTCVLSK